jgi:hypothetical protein
MAMTGRYSPLNKVTEAAGNMAISPPATSTIQVSFASQIGKIELMICLRSLMS